MARRWLRTLRSAACSRRISPSETWGDQSRSTATSSASHSRSKCRSAAPPSSGSAGPARRCSVSGRLDPLRWGSRCTWPSGRRSRTSWTRAKLAITRCHTALVLRDGNHGAERHRLDAGGCRVLSRPRRPPARVPGDARRRAPFRPRDSAVVAVGKLAAVATCVARSGGRDNREARARGPQRGSGRAAPTSLPLDTTASACCSPAQ